MAKGGGRGSDITALWYPFYGQTKDIMIHTFPQCPVFVFVILICVIQIGHMEGFVFFSTLPLYCCLHTLAVLHFLWPILRFIADNEG